MGKEWVKFTNFPVVVVILSMAGKRTVTKVKTTTLFTDLVSAAAEGYVAVAYDFGSATGYEVFDAGYALEDLLMAKKKSQLQCGSSL